MARSTGAAVLAFPPVSFAVPSARCCVLWQLVGSTLEQFTLPKDQR